ncbi:MAG: 16S rRNA (guanine(527)-N(7))-methyltransferase RsmG [Solirubrobacteraceae bacterium]
MHAVDALASRFGLDDAAADSLTTLLQRVANDPFAPTTVSDVNGILNDHLADSLIVLELSDVRDAVTIADVGSGAGFPGLPVAIALPNARVSLIDGNGRKCDFIAASAVACGVTNIEVVHARVEAWPEGTGRHDLVMVRAVAPLSVVAEYAAPLLRMGGSLVAWRGRRDRAEEAGAARAAAELGLDVRPPIAVEPYPGALHRHLHRLVKVSPTPDRFPRRPGVARKRPLGRLAARSDRRHR